MQAIGWVKNFVDICATTPFKQLPFKHQFSIVATAFAALALVYVAGNSLYGRFRKPTDEENQIRDLLNDRQVFDRKATLKDDSGTIELPHQVERELQSKLDWSLNGQSIYNNRTMAASAYRALVIALGGDSNKAGIVSMAFQQGGWAYILAEMREKFNESVTMKSQVVDMTIRQGKVTIIHGMGFQRFTTSESGDKIPLGTRVVIRTIQFNIRDIQLGGTYPSLRVNHTYSDQVDLPKAE